MHYVQSKINLIQGHTYEEMDGTLKVDNNLVGKTLQMALNSIWYYVKFRKRPAKDFDPFVAKKNSFTDNSL